METDYTPGDPPLKVGTVVDYFGSLVHGAYVVSGHAEPQNPHNMPQADLSLLFPDGVGYELWPEGMERKFGNRDWAVFNARRPNLRVVRPPQEGIVP